MQVYYTCCSIIKSSMASEATLSTAERTRRTERLLEICLTLSTSLELESFLYMLIAAANELTNCETASILEPDEGGEQLHFLALPWFHREVLEQVRVPVRSSVAGWVFEKGKPAVVPDVKAEPRHFKGVDKAANFITHDLMAVPITFQSEKLGVLEVVNKTRGAHYTEDDLTILETLASQAAIAIQSAHLAIKDKKSLEQMAQLELMKSEFIAIASHELRTPLGLVLGHATFLREVIPDEFHAQLDTIIRNAIRLRGIIDSLASMDNTPGINPALHLTSVSVKRISEDVIGSFEQEAQKKRIKMRTDIDQGDLMVEGDASKVSVAISNVVKNALDFTNPGGHISIHAEPMPGYVKVSVIDDGIGIPKKDLAHIFERFYQVESHLTRKHGGMGLGLSVAKVMVEMHGGRIWAESEEGKGSNISLILPVTQGQVEADSRALTS
jgi:signal transduction histidine kinase